MICDVLAIELTDERRREITNLDAAELTALLARLGEHRRWTSPSPTTMRTCGVRRHGDMRTEAPPTATPRVATIS